MMLDGEDRTPLYHCLVRVPACFILVDQWDNVRTEHVGTKGLVCSSEGLKVLPDVSEGMLGVSMIPLGLIFAEEIAIVLFLP